MDILITSAKKDHHKLPAVLNLLESNLVDGIDNIFIITPSAIDPYFNDQMPGHYVVSDDEIESQLEFKKSEILYRPNWVFQQFAKFFFDCPSGDEYLIVDSDLLMIAPISIYKEKKPRFFLGIDQNHEQYFNFQRKLLGFGKNYDRSFICEFWLCRKKIIAAMLESIGATPQEFVRRSIDILNTDPTCHIGEPELYGSFVQKTCPDEYGFQSLKTNLFGKHGGSWNAKEIQQAIAVGKLAESQTVTIHNWDANA